MQGLENISYHSSFERQVSHTKTYKPTITTSHLLGYPSSKRQITTTIDENVEKLEPSYTPDENAKWAAALDNSSSKC